jgi:hypothetical protein
LYKLGEHKGPAALSLDMAAEYLMLVTESSQQAAPEAGAAAELSGLSSRERGTGDPGRPGTHRRADRQAAVHQREHSPLAPGRIRDKTGSRRRADLTRLALQAGLV